MLEESNLVQLFFKLIAARGQYHGAAYDYAGSKYHQMFHTLFLIHNNSIN